MFLKKSGRRGMALLLLVMMLTEPMAAWGEETGETTAPVETVVAAVEAQTENEETEADEAPVQKEISHVAIAKTSLKVRVKPDQKSKGNGSIEKGETVYILELGEEWCKVRTKRNDGYIMTKYLSNIQENPDPAGGMGAFADASISGTASAVGATETVDPESGFTMTEATFEENFKAYTEVVTNLYEKPYANARKRKQIKMYQKVIVGEVNGDWCFVKYNSYYGYVPTNSLFKWDRINAYAGEIPGQDLWPYLAFVNHSTTIYGTEDNKALKTINPGAAIAVGEKNAQGQYILPYWRTTGYITEDDIAYIMPVVDWQEAKSGDLISVMTTYFAVGISTLQYQGRNWNIHLSASMITGTVLQPGETYNQNKTIGPYAESTGYHKAPVMSAHTTWGYGGGTCQVTSTFYIANIVLPILVTHRKVHADVGIYYCRKGFDAAVGGNDINLTLENTMPYAIRYQFFISDGVLTCCIFKE